MEYIEWLRSKVGPEKVLIPATAVVLLNQKGEVLLHIRGSSGEWGLPGGLMDLGETVMEGLRREVKEETGLLLGDAQLYGIFSGPNFEVKYSNGDRTSPVILGFFSQDFSGDLSSSEESPDLAFFPLDKLPAPLNQSHQLFLEGFLRFKQEGSLRPTCE